MRRAFEITRRTERLGDGLGLGGRRGRPRGGLFKLLQRDLVDGPAACAMHVEVASALGTRRLQSELDLLSAEGEAPATPVTAKLHLEAPPRAENPAASIVPAGKVSASSKVARLVAADLRYFA